MRRLGIKLGDLILSATVLIAAIFLFLSPLLASPSGSAEIIITETEEKRVVSLDKEASYEINTRGVTLTITVKDGSIFVAHSDCRDGICRKTPPISRAGQSIVCAPAGVVVRILGEEVIVDGVSG